MKRWYVAYTNPNAERRAVAHLRRQGFETFLPVYARTRSHARRVERVFRPVFPGYVFVAIDVSNARWRSINGTVGVRHLVSFGDAPAPAPRGVVESMLAQADNAGVVSPAVLMLLEPGRRVRVLDGPLADQVGILERMTSDQRVVLLLQALGREVEVTLPRDAIDAA